MNARSNAPAKSECHLNTWVWGDFCANEARVYSPWFHVFSIIMRFQLISAWNRHGLNLLIPEWLRSQFLSHAMAKHRAFRESTICYFTRWCAGTHRYCWSGQELFLLAFKPTLKHPKILLKQPRLPLSKSSMKQKGLGWNLTRSWNIAHFMNVML